MNVIIDRKVISMPNADVLFVRAEIEGREYNGSVTASLQLPDAKTFTLQGQMHGVSREEIAEVVAALMSNLNEER